VVAIAGFLIFNSFYVWSTGARLEARLLELRRAGEPVQLSDLAREPIPPESNAQTFLDRADADLEAIQKELTALYPKAGGPPETLPPADRTKLEKLFDAYPKALSLLEQAAARLDDDTGLDFSLPTMQFLNPYMKSIAKHRSLARILRTLTMLRIAQGRRDEAISPQILTLRLTRSWRREPLLIGFLMRMACEHTATDAVNQVLQSGAVSSATRQALDAELAQHDNLEGLRWALKSERAFSLSSARDIPGTGFWLTRGLANRLMLTLLELYDFHLESTSLPYRETKGRKFTPRSQGFLPNPYASFSRLLDPSLLAARAPAESNRARVRALRTLNALQSHATPEGEAPALADLGLPTEATTDPFNGEPLRVKKSPRGWTVYSVGFNGVDDGGDVEGYSETLDIGFGPLPPAEPPKKPAGPEQSHDPEVR